MNTGRKKKRWCTHIVQRYLTRNDYTLRVRVPLISPFHSFLVLAFIDIRALHIFFPFQKLFILNNILFDLISMTKIQWKKKRNNFALCLDFAEQNTYYPVLYFACTSFEALCTNSFFFLNEAFRCVCCISLPQNHPENRTNSTVPPPSLEYAHVRHDSTKKTAFHNSREIYIYI